MRTLGISLFAMVRFFVNLFTDYCSERLSNSHSVMQVDTTIFKKKRANTKAIYRYANAVKDASGLPGIWGFVDGSMRPFCRPREDQACFYSEYNKAHAFKFQSIITHDGLLSSLVGPFPGRVGNWVVWHSSGIVEILQNLFTENGVSEE